MFGLVIGGGGGDRLGRRPACRHLPLCYGAVSDHLRRLTIDAACFMVAPPDDHGICSFGPVCDFLPDLWARIPIRIGVINPRLPRSHGTAGIPLSDLTLAIEDDQELPVASPGGDDATRAMTVLLRKLAGHDLGLVVHARQFLPQRGVLVRVGVHALRGVVRHDLGLRRL